jgi:hypothetical protein
MTTVMFVTLPRSSFEPERKRRDFSHSMSSALLVDVAT